MLHAGSGTVVSLSRQVYACPGEQLKLACTVNNIIALWMITLSKVNITKERFVGSGSVTQIIVPFNGIDDVIFNFKITSEVPLTTELCTNEVNNNMHGATINCLQSRDSDPIITFIIHVLEGRCGNLRIIHGVIMQRIYICVLLVIDDMH